MSTISEIARITVKGAPKGTSGDSPTERAWLLYTAAMEQALREGVTPNPDGTVVWVGNMKGIAKSLWPEVNWENGTDAENWMIPVYSAFRDNGVARVVERNIDKDPTRNRWLLSPTFDVRMDKAKVKAYQASYTEKRLSKAEAGEDREPAPVTVSKTESKASKPAQKASKSSKPTEQRRRNDDPTLVAERTARLTARGEFPCPHCSKVFPSQGAIGGHMKAHNPEIARPHKCRVCRRGFTTPVGLSNHLRMHEAQKVQAAPTVLSDVALRKQQKNKNAAAASAAAPVASPVTSTVPGATLEYAAPATAGLDVTSAVQALVQALNVAAAQNAAALQAENQALKAQLEQVRSIFANTVPASNAS